MFCLTDAMHPDLEALEQQFSPSVFSEIKHPLLFRNGLQLYLKRDDLLHPVISGNKWRKLKYSLEEALKLGKNTLISMGGAYSNHLHALAFTGKILGLKTIGIISGERPRCLSPTLTDLTNWGMELRFVSRADYRELRQYHQTHEFPGLKPHEYWIPEGGANRMALKGCKELVDEIGIDYDILCVPCGTGATLAGLVAATENQKKVLGFSALKNAGFLNSTVERLISVKKVVRWDILMDYHCGGFAKINNELTSFIKEFEENTAIPLEPVYTGKMMFGLFDLIEKGYFQPGQRIIAVHTGGLQGKRGYC